MIPEADDDLGGATTSTKNTTTWPPTSPSWRAEGDEGEVDWLSMAPHMNITMSRLAHQAKAPMAA